LLEKIVLYAIQQRIAVIVALVALLVGGAQAARTLRVDAIPDVSSVQVDIITKVGGLSPVEVERSVTLPIENAVNGLPRAAEVRSISRFGLSAVTVVFHDGTDVWFARQMVLERIRQVQGDLPPTAEVPELGPVSTGLGTIYKFVVRSSKHSAMQLRTILDWEIVPKLRSVPGVIEVNSFGGDLKQYQIIVDRTRLRARDLTLKDVVDALEAASMNVGGGYVERAGESYTIRGDGMVRDEREIADVVVRAKKEKPAILVKDVAVVRVDAALKYGVVTHNGDREAVSGHVMMLMGANSRDVVYAVKHRMEQIREELPAGAEIVVVYDRAEFVDSTLRTVATNLLEGLAVVTLVLAIMLGTVRGAVVVALGIPSAMAVALFGMHVFNVTGDLMSLGAIDFGFLVDGPIVVLEAVIAATAGHALTGEHRARAYSQIVKGVVTPVAFAVAIIMLVYIPLLTLEGVEGKMFRPMALTMACALLGALIYSVLFFPALLVTFVPPAKHHGGGWIDRLQARCGSLIELAIAWRWGLIPVGIAALVGATFAFGRAGAEFVPRIFEGDCIVAMQRAPSISLEEARRLDLMAEKSLLEFAEVEQALGQSGRPELALDAVGNGNTDILIPLRPLKEWKNASEFDELSELIKDKIETEVPSTFVSVSQPIEDLTNQLIAGSRADVSIKIFGPDLQKLVAYSNKIGAIVGAIQGTGDLKIERILGQPMISATPDRARMARYGVRLRDAFDVLACAREGLKVGTVYDQERRFDVRVLMPPAEPTASALGDLFVESGSGASVPLRDVLNITEGDGPSVVKRLNRSRLIRVDVNLRGRDLVSWVQEAKAKVARAAPAETGYRIEWGGQFENFERASARLALVIPAVGVVIIVMLLWMFRSLRPALAVFSLVPFATIGGMCGLLARGLPFSLPAAIGFIALGGISVLNGVVIASEALRRIDRGERVVDAVVGGTVHSMRAVLTTGAVAGLGFLPMALSSGAGSEAQRPLATVVVVGILLATLFTLVVFPGVIAIALKGSARRSAADSASVLPRPRGAE
jgi:heavy metal efflux system protein